MIYQNIPAYPNRRYPLGTAQTPTIQTLDKVCKGFGITLSQFFSEGDDPISLTPEQGEMLDNWSALNPKQQQIIMDLLRNMF